MAMSQPNRGLPDRGISQAYESQQTQETQPEPALPGQTDVHSNGQTAVRSNGTEPAAHTVHVSSPFQQLSMDRRHSWDEPRMHQARMLDSLGNEQAPGANRQFSLELTTYASIPVRDTQSGFRPPHRSAISAQIEMLSATLIHGDAILILWLAVSATQGGVMSSSL